MAVSTPLQVEVLCEEYVNGQAAEGGPKQLARGKYASVSARDAEIALLTIEE